MVISKSTIKIGVGEIEQFAEVCAALTKQGVIFTAVAVNKEWVITLTGGF